MPSPLLLAAALGGGLTLDTPDAFVPFGTSARFDLAGAPGAKRVILITDGEENCGGNVEAEIAALRKSGIDVELDVVGFAIDSAASGRAFEKWAALGGGRYYEAKDAATLDTAVRAAVPC